MNPELRIWDYRWVRDLAVLLGVALLLLAMYAARAVVVPALVGLGLAYVANPLVSWAARRGVSRLVSTLMLIVLGAAALLLMLLFVVPQAIEQAVELARKLAHYANWASHRLRESDTGVQGLFNSMLPEAPTTDPGTAATQPAANDLQRLGPLLLRALNVGVMVVTSAIGVIVYLGFALVVSLICFFYLSWRLEALVAWVKTLIPSRHRERTLHIIGRMDRTVSAFVRGRLVQAAVMAMILIIGWGVAGVPYWLLLGMLCGMLNMVPYLASLGCAAAVVLSLVEPLSGGETFHLRLVWLPIAIYLFAQLIDGWVVEPIVQSKATELHPLAVLLAVLIFGSLMGALGMLLAIPVTACLKILSEELVMPRLRSM